MIYGYLFALTFVYPPLTGGMIAISSEGFTMVSPEAYSPLTAKASERNDASAG